MRWMQRGEGRHEGEVLGFGLEYWGVWCCHLLRKRSMGNK